MTDKYKFEFDCENTHWSKCHLDKSKHLSKTVKVYFSKAYKCYFRLCEYQIKSNLYFSTSTSIRSWSECDLVEIRIDKEKFCKKK